MGNRRSPAVLVGLLLLVGLVAPATVGTPAAAQPADPATDVLGWENGYWHNESIDVDQSDGLSDAELKAYVSRAMARIELIREREFKKTVPVSVIPRNEFANRTAPNSSGAFGAWNNQVWEALFIVGEDQDTQEQLHSTSTAATTGGYFPLSDEIKILTDDPEATSIDRRTLVHELVHAQQDQYVNLTDPAYQGETQDEQLAADGLVEGEANYIEDRYAQRCSGEWECVPTASSGGGGGSQETNVGILITLFQPYSDGPSYVRSLVERGGWSAVDERFAAPPNSTEQIIHRTDMAPAPLSVTDNATAGWETFPEQGINGTDTLGEASIFTMLWYQSRNYGADTIPVRTIGDASGPYDVYNYESLPSSGWSNDAVLPYRKETTEGTQYGYVWTIEWDTETDATQFLAAYRAILRAHDARQLGQRTWVIDSGPYADAFRLAKDGTRVTIVNAPAADDLDDLRPGLQAVSRTTTTTRTASDQPDPPIDTPAQTPEAEPTAAVEQPGFGTLAALAAIAIVGLLGRQWRRP